MYTLGPPRFEDSLNDRRNDLYEFLQEEVGELLSEFFDREDIATMCLDCELSAGVAFQIVMQDNNKNVIDGGESPPDPTHV